MGLADLGPFALTGYFLGVLYPAYQSFRALETVDPRDDQQWLTYWVVFSLIWLFETLFNGILHWIPFYHIMKLGFILWLILPQTQGAVTLYQTYLKPFLKQYAAKIDPIFEGSEQALKGDFMPLVKQLQEVYGAQNANNLLHSLSTKDQSNPFAKEAMNLINNLQKQPPTNAPNKGPSYTDQVQSNAPYANYKQGQPQDSHQQQYQSNQQKGNSRY